MQRKNGDGSFRKLPNGSFEFTVSVGYDIYGKHQRKRFYGKTESECRKKHKDFLKGGEKQTSETKEPTLSEWLDIWLTICKKSKVQSSTYEDYVHKAGHIKRHSIGGMKLAPVSEPDTFGFSTVLTKLWRPRLTENPLIHSVILTVLFCKRTECQ